MNLQGNILEWLRLEVAAANTEISKSRFRDGMCALLKEAKKSPKPPDSYDKLEAICDDHTNRLKGCGVFEELFSTRTSWVCRIDRDKLDDVLRQEFAQGPYSFGKLRHGAMTTTLEAQPWKLLEYMWSRQKAPWTNPLPPTSGMIPRG